MELTKKTFDTKKIEEQRFEFILFANGHIVCQRYFNIREFNENSTKSWEMKELMDNICGVYGETMGIIPKFLKKISEDLLWNTHNPFGQPYSQPMKNNYEKIDEFTFEIKIDKKSVAKSLFYGNIFPQKVRYDVNIKEIIQEIMAEIREYLSRKEYDKVVA